MWRASTQRSRCPSACAAWTYSCWSFGEDHAAGETGDARHVDDADRQRGAGASGSHDGHEAEREQQGRERQQRVHAPHQHVVDGAARVARERADRDADHQRQRDGGRADADREACAPHQPRQHVAPELVGAEQVRAARALEQRAEVHRHRIGGDEDRRHQPDERREPDDGQPHERQAAARQPAERPAALRAPLRRAGVGGRGRHRACRRPGSPG